MKLFEFSPIYAIQIHLWWIEDLCELIKCFSLSLSVEVNFYNVVTLCFINVGSVEINSIQCWNGETIIPSNRFIS